jgi:alpha-D-ribose 1-methylphosphonate 5-triphosphate synthase subunit PhnL
MSASLPDAAPVLSIADLGKSFHIHSRQQHVPSVSGVQLELHAGTVTVLVGPSGAGKSSILKCIWRSYLPSSGSIRYRDRAGREIDLASASEQQVLELRLSDMAFVTQFLHCPPRRPARTVVATPLLLQGVPEPDALARAEDMLERLAVPRPLWDLSPATFSGGERQRVNLARGLVGDPRLLLLDEPTASLDAASAATVLALIRRARGRGTAILAIVHDLETVAAIADQTYALTLPVAA